jgi:hypothetical protein
LTLTTAVFKRRYYDSAAHLKLIAGRSGRLQLAEALDGVVGAVANSEAYAF